MGTTSKWKNFLGFQNEGFKNSQNFHGDYIKMEKLLGIPKWGAQKFSKFSWGLHQNGRTSWDSKMGGLKNFKIFMGTISKWKNLSGFQNGSSKILNFFKL
jgi:hypothetical protein